jgi:hypothetical protein
MNVRRKGMKRITKMTISAAFLATIATGGYIAADQTIVKKVSGDGFYVSYDNIEDRIAGADLIVKAKVTGNHKNVSYDQGGLPSGYTLTEIKVGKVIKGENLEEKTINIREPYITLDNGLIPGKTELTWEDYTKLQSNAQYILFLTWSEATQTYDVSSGNEGKYNMDNKDLPEEQASLKAPRYKNLRDAVKVYYKDLKDVE